MTSSRPSRPRHFYNSYQATQVEIHLPQSQQSPPGADSRRAVIDIANIYVWLSWNWKMMGTLAFLCVSNVDLAFVQPHAVRHITWTCLM